MAEDPFGPARKDLAAAVVSRTVLGEDRAYLEQAVSELVSREVLEKFRAAARQGETEAPATAPPHVNRAAAKRVLGTALTNRILLRAMVLKFRASGNLDPRGRESWRVAQVVGWVMVGVEAFLLTAGAVVLAVGVSAFVKVPGLPAASRSDVFGATLLLIGVLFLTQFAVFLVRERTNFTLALRMTRAYALSAKGAPKDEILHLLELPL